MDNSNQFPGLPGLRLRPGRASVTKRAFISFIVWERERCHSQTQAGHRLIMDVIIWSNPLGLATQRPLTMFGEQKCCHGLSVILILMAGHTLAASV